MTLREKFTRALDAGDKVTVLDLFDTISGHPLGSEADNEHHRATGEQVPKMTTVYVVVDHTGCVYKTEDEELAIKNAQRVRDEMGDPGLMRRVAAKAGVDLGGNRLPHLTDVTIEGGKYTVRQIAAGKWEALRHGKYWPAYPDGPDNLHVAMAQEIDELRKERVKLQDENERLRNGEGK